MKKLYFLSKIVSNVVLVDTTSLWCSVEGLDCGAHSVTGLPWLLSFQEQPQLITVWIPVMVMVIYFQLVKTLAPALVARCVSHCMIHTVPHLITGARKKGVNRQIWWPRSRGDSTVVSRTSDRVSVYSSQHNEWSKVWFKWASCDPSNCSSLSVITIFVCTLLGTPYWQPEAGLLF